MANKKNHTKGRLDYMRYTNKLAMVGVTFNKKNNRKHIFNALLRIFVCSCAQFNRGADSILYVISKNSSYEINLVYIP